MDGLCRLRALPGLAPWVVCVEDMARCCSCQSLRCRHSVSSSGSKLWPPCRGACVTMAGGCLSFGQIATGLPFVSGCLDVRGGCCAIGLRSCPNICKVRWRHGACICSPQRQSMQGLGRDVPGCSASSCSVPLLVTAIATFATQCRPSELVLPLGRRVCADLWS